MRALWMASECARRTNFASLGMEVSYVSYAPGLVGTGNGAPYIFFYVSTFKNDDGEIVFSTLTIVRDGKEEG